MTDEEIARRVADQPLPLKVGDVIEFIRPPSAEFHGAVLRVVSVTATRINYVVLEAPACPALVGRGAYDPIDAITENPHWWRRRT